MAQTSGSSSWAQLAAGALGGVLSYEAGQANGVASNSNDFNQPDTAAYYYGQNVSGQPTVGASSGMSTTEVVLIVAAVAALGFLAFKFLR